MWEETLETHPDPNTEPCWSLPPKLEIGMVARSTDNLDSSGEPGTRSVGTTANLKGKMSKRLSVVKGHFPKLIDCAHFHYENVDFGSIELQFANEQSDASWTLGSAKDLVFLVQVSCQGKTWMVRRSYEEFRTLDAHLHQCIYDRRYSQLLVLPALCEIGDRVEIFTPLLSEYLNRLSMIVDNKLNCGPVLSWMEIDNHGNRFLLKEEASLNVPAIAAAHVIKRYTAQASDEISIEVGDILSVIDMPPKEDTTWWRGKHGFQVGFFPSECVELINEKLQQSVSAPVSKQEVDHSSSKPGVTNTTGPSSPTSVSKKHGKLMGFLRTFMKSRPTKQKLKQRGILKERVFGCDLGEHLLNSGQDVPQVLKSCSEFIEKHGVVDGIYRHSGVSSNIQKLRHEFDSENVPDLTKDVYMQDIHCVGSLCKLYFRELPNPLLTYQLYDKFAECMGEMTDEERMVKVHDVIQQLPPPHYRTLEYLIKHLSGLATCSGETNMHIKNLAIVWAPNLLRSKEIEAAGLSGADPFKEVRIQSVVVEFLLSNVEVLFSDSFTSVGRFNAARQSLTRPKSFASTRLLSLEEAQARTQAPLLLQGSPHHALGQFHTVLDLPADKRKRGMKVRKSAGGSWKTFFAIGKPAAAGRRKPTRITSLFQPTTSHAGCRVDSVTLRSAKSEESLSSQHSGAGQGKMQRLRRPRSSSDGLSLAASVDPQLLPQHSPSRIHPSRSYDSLLPEEMRDADEEENEEEEDEEGVYMLPDFSKEPSTSWMAEDVIDFSPTFLEDGPIGLGSTAVAPSGRESPPAAAPPPYRCLSHQGHTRSGSQRSITEDPDSVLNQSEAAARRSLILAAAAPPQQVFCQHRPSAVTNAPASTTQQGESNLSPSHSQTPAPAASSPPSQPPQERRSFTRKVVHALSSKAPKSPPMDISDPISISVPAKVLEMIGGRAGELQPGPPSSGPSQPPQMISMLLRSCDFQLTESCQQELNSKLGPIAKIKGPSIFGPTGVPLPSQQPPPPPPKNPARLMALALAESANKALRQGASPPYRPRQSGTSPETDIRLQRSLSADAGALLSSDSNQIYSTVRPLSVWKTEGDDDGGTAAEKLADKSHGTDPRSQPGQDSGTLSSDSSVSDSGTSNSELSVASSSEDNERSPSPIYKNEEPTSSAQPSKSSPPSSSEAILSQRKPPAYGRQFSAPQLQQDKSTGQPKPAAQPHTQLLHSKSESSPLAQVRAFQPTRPKVPPKPPDLAPLRAPLSQTDRHDYMRRSLDASRIRRLAGAPQGNTPLSRAFSERISSTSDMLSRYHAARMASQAVQVAHLPQQQQQQTQSTQIRTVVPSEDPSKMENFYYEIGAPEHPKVPPSYARHSYQNMKLDLEGNLRLTDPANQRPISRGYPPPYNPQGPVGSRAPQLWSSEATRAWAAAHSHSFSFSHSHHRSHDGSSGHPPHPRPQRQTSSSVRLPRSEIHPLPASGVVGSSAGIMPLSVHQRSVHRPQRSPSADHTASQLHPYFENGKVCYRYFEASRPEDILLHQQSVLKPPQTSPVQGITKDQPEPIYVNYPFTNPQGSGVNSKSWATTNLDENDHQASETLELPSKSQPEDKQKLSEHESPTVSFDNLAHNDVSSDSKETNIAASASTAMHFRSRSDPQSISSEPVNVLSGKEIASLLIEKLAEDEREGPSAPSSSSSSPHIEHPPNPYPSQPQQPPPAYNIYTPGPSRGHFESQMPPRDGSGPFQRQDPLRRSSGGQYRQAFDVMPSGDQVLKFYRSQDFVPVSQGESTNPNPYPPRPYYQDPPHHNWGPQGLPEASHTCTPPTVAFSNLALGSARGYGPQTVANQYPYQSGSVLPQYPNTPRRDVVLDPSLRPPGLRNQRGLNRQGSLPGPNWTIRTEGQTRSYC
ncbi:rho GTPase-activating protein 33 isoform X3 [Pimephales promelas]|uniref:rho GTPase-activating protein 33 isoform X3 n=1 Tax=Pimephales promelas TaxID=90988 RepID=UPI001955F109|nr:rho GTPase-activating protein 33 isoform X3 [Pimephales promelas]KAG1936805.1 rho GTPase-activating protein [Pimephales promelas]